MACRISPKSLKFLRSIRAENPGRAIDQLVAAHQAVLTAIRNRVAIHSNISKRQPAELDLPRIKKEG